MQVLAEAWFAAARSYLYTQVPRSTSIGYTGSFRALHNAPVAHYPWRLPATAIHSRLLTVANHGKTPGREQPGL